MAEDSRAGVLRGLSDELSTLTARVAPSVVRIEDGSRLTATGVVWSEDGIVVSTSHGVERDEDLGVELPDGTLAQASLIGRDPDTDIAVLRVQSDSLVPVSRGNTDTALVGSLVIAVARPGRTGLQATLGMITARVETESGGRAEYLLHTDADMYPGFSGGALVDADGNIVGLVNLMFGRGRGVALGAPTVANITQALVTGGRVQRGYLGVRTQEVALPESVRAGLDRAQGHALLIAQVETSSPAEGAGLLLGDTLIEFAGEPITDVESLRRLLRRNPPGATISLQIVRGGTFARMGVTLGAEQ